MCERKRSYFRQTRYIRLLSQTPPFVDQESGALQTRQMWTEAFELIGLMLLFGALALIPFPPVSFGPPGYLIETVLVVLMQCILLVGS